jgi:hypothetical protein
VAGGTSSPNPQAAGDKDDALSVAKAVPFATPDNVHPLWKTIARGLQTEPESCRSHGMTAANVLKNPAFQAEDDARLCADYMGPHLQELIDYATAQYKNRDAVSWALHWGFAFILYELGHPRKLQISVATYKAMQGLEPDRAAAARDCKKRLQEIILDTKRKGFSRTATAYGMVEAISNINMQGYREFLPPERAQRETDELTELLLIDLKKARPATVH